MELLHVKNSFKVMIESTVSFSVYLDKNAMEEILEHILSRISIDSIMISRNKVWCLVYYMISNCI